MTMIRRIFIDDLRRITGNIVSVIILVGLVAIPSLFAWFNITANWDPFGNLGNLKFAVASVDEGYESDLIPIKVTIGDQVVNELRANSELDWTITTKEDAIDGTQSGKYYAAIVIPKNFSRTMMTFFSDDAQHANVTYYRNEKKNAISPNLTNEGADEVAAQVNEQFASSMTDAALSIASSLADRISDPESQQMLTSFNVSIANFATRLTDTADSLNAYGTLTDSTETLLSGSAALLSRTVQAADSAGTQLDSAHSDVTDLTGALDDAMSALGTALDNSHSSFETLDSTIADVFADAERNVDDAQQSLRSQADAIGVQTKAFEQIRDALLKLPEITQDSSVITSLQSVIDQLNTLQTTLIQAADNMQTASDDAAAQRNQAQQLAQQAAQNIANIRTDFDRTIRPQAKQLGDSVRDITSILKAGASDLDDAVDDVNTTSVDVNTRLDQVKTTMDDVSTQLADGGKKLGDFNSKLAAALENSDVDAIHTLLDGDATSLATSLAAPVALERKAVFPVENFGSSMAPYYTFIPLWTASLLIGMTVRTSVSRRRLEALAADGVAAGAGKIEASKFGARKFGARKIGAREAATSATAKPHQIFLGHFGIFAVISLLQTTVSCGGSLLFLGVQAVHPLLFMLSGWISGLVFVLFAYTLVVSFGNVGKAIGMLLLVFQVSGSAGSYPAQTLPPFMQALSPWLPITHSINAMRAAIAGIYNNDFWHEIGILLAFVPPLLLLGLLLRKPLVGFNHWLEEKLESTKLIG